eukprot:gene12138-biopygen7917
MGEESKSTIPHAPWTESSTRGAPSRPRRRRPRAGLKNDPCFFRVNAHEMGFPEQTTPRSLAFAPRCEPPRARAPGAQMIRVGAGSSLAFQRVSRRTLYTVLSARLAETRFQDKLRQARLFDFRGLLCHAPDV